jgi:hypothetical protein
LADEGECHHTFFRLPTPVYNKKGYYLIFIKFLGPSGCGKTTFVYNLLQNAENFCSVPPKFVIYFYNVWQEIYKEMKEKGLVNIFIKDNSDLLDQIKRHANINSLIIFDDMINTSNMKQIAELYTVQIRHRNLNAIFLSQKLFISDDFFRQISQNSDYFVVFKNPRNSTDIRTLSSQMTGNNQLLQIYEAATKEPYSYLFINLTQECIKHVKFLSALFKIDFVVQTYVSSDCPINDYEGEL